MTFKADEETQLDHDIFFSIVTIVKDDLIGLKKSWCGEVEIAPPSSPWNRGSSAIELSPHNFTNNNLTCERT